LGYEPRHPKLQALRSRRRLLQNLITVYGIERVERAFRVADLEYRPPNGIRNAFGLIRAMCEELDDTRLVERERRLAEERRRRERERALEELRARGCKVCGFWQVLPSGYCYEHDPRYREWEEVRLHGGPCATDAHSA